MAKTYEDGLTAANERIRAVMSDKRIKGQEMAGIALAVRAPAMTAEEVITTVAGAAAAGNRAAGLSAAVDYLIHRPAQR